MVSRDKVRLGVIGLGNIAKQHIQNVCSGVVTDCEVSAICSRSENEFSRDLGLNHFTDYKTLIDSKKIDAVLIATPTYSHMEIAKYALQHGIHIMLEKPIALSSYEGEHLLSIKPEGLSFAVMLNQRMDPTYALMKQIIESGDIGEITRTHWTMTNWFRPEIYFQVSDWRATFVGEGGGALVNQCIHNLDIFQWICGMPKQVHAFCEFGKYHDIEVEDEVSAFLRYDNGATGVFVASTGEAPGVNRFDIIGDKGSLHYDNGELTRVRNSQSTLDYSRTTDNMFGMPDSTRESMAVTEQVNQHAAIMNNFVKSILHGDALWVPAESALDSLDLANSMLLSTWNQAAVKFPLDRAEYHGQLSEKISQSSLREKSDKSAKIDMDASYR